MQNISIFPLCVLWKCLGQWHKGNLIQRNYTSNDFLTLGKQDELPQYLEWRVELCFCVEVVLDAKWNHDVYRQCNGQQACRSWCLRCCACPCSMATDEERANAAWFPVCECICFDMITLKNSNDVYSKSLLEDQSKLVGADHHNIMLWQGLTLSPTHHTTGSSVEIQQGPITCISSSQHSQHTPVDVGT